MGEEKKWFETNIAPESPETDNEQEKWFEKTLEQTHAEIEETTKDLNPLQKKSWLEKLLKSFKFADDPRVEEQNPPE